MRAAVDGRHLRASRGVAAYSREMLAALARQSLDLRVFVPGRGPATAPPGLPLVRHRLPSRAIFAAAALTGRPRLDRLAGGADVAWVPAPAPIAVSDDVPLVLTVHDLSWLERPGDFTAYERLWHGLARMQRLARRADRVVVDAAATGDLIADRWGVTATVVHPGIPRRPQGELPAGIPDCFLLSVGALEPRKDPELLARAHARAGIDAALVFAGGGRLADGLRRPGVHVVEDATDEQLGALYARATALVSASRLEGFGFPPLEAAAAGTPSVLSDLPVFRETLGDAALYVPVGDEEAWVDALRRATTEALPVAEVDRFTWDRAAAELRAVFDEVAR